MFQGHRRMRTRKIWMVKESSHNEKATKELMYLYNSVQPAGLGTTGRIQRTTKSITIKDSKYVKRRRIWVYNDFI